VTRICGVMSIPVACVAAAWLLLYLPRLGVMAGQRQRPEGYDNHNPRAQQAKLEGWAARARAAEQNGHEAFPAFAAAAILCLVRGADGPAVTIPCVAFLVLRTAYVGLYIGDVPQARSAVWAGGMLCIGALFLAALSP
jgi:uncharacterized MAPEG superfamily protein